MTSTPATTTSPSAGGNAVSSGGDAKIPAGPAAVNLTIDGVAVSVPKGTLVIRAAGPSLGAFGVPGTLDDPMLEIFAGTVKTGANDNWGGTAVLTNAMTQVGAFAIPTTSKDAALLVTLQPGFYSVQVVGVGGAGGLVLVEVHEAP